MPSVQSKRLRIKETKDNQGRFVAVGVYWSYKSLFRFEMKAAKCDHWLMLSAA